MSERDLPEELVLSILALCFDLPCEDFLRFPTADGARKSTSRNTDLLLVSKRWLRVGSPLLFTSLRLSHPSHATSVAHQLRCNPGLGSAIRNLRIEGDCGDNLCEVLELAPKIERLYIALDQKTNTRTEGLRRAFAYTNPKEVFIMDMTRLLRAFSMFPWGTSVRADEAMAAAEHAIAEHWTELRCIHFGPCSEITPSLFHALERANAARAQQSCPPLRVKRQRASVGIW
ncbi:uncharacterized protein PHACADRAFT_154096 [Phanerochaete carnosa HHB-10118-sp]|uniref:F-box domain-containing protein n=1 Tax=Phanerochaete carnosa (strain HHB-10118-sp) TaxID=650164 RepID=K5WHC0_PHACS|nr:uncharacterized protein PHACADRAFT_154096 [Phanerochaete carnosa HHB-10118-sp]EKM49617.1 hypothetical protein PHACADRAFT_154096 [Phanerochaete carnosa HHB-10118-sp]